jgi:hypothetical protein
VQARVPIAGVGLLLGVACVSMGSVTSGPTASTASPDPASSASTPAGPPIELRAGQPGVWSAEPGNWSVALTWMPAPDFEADHYEVTRDGERLDDVPGTRLVDDAVLPRTTYRYGVTGVDAAGARTETASVKVKTNAPPLTAARLEGRFRMRMQVVQQSGLREGVGGGTMLFLFDPACAEGPCNVTWRRRGRAGSGRLLRRGAHYGGTANASFQIHTCHGRSRKERLTFAMNVEAADVIDGRWRATRIRGRLHESAPAPGCITARIHWRFAGSMQS